MFSVKGKIREVVPGKQVRGAFGFQDALLLRVEREPGKDFTDSVFVPDTPGNRAALREGALFDAPCMVEATQYQGGRPYIVVRSGYEAESK